ncbi:DEAD/DEAH box helicase [Sphaerotilus uruguayifluvii]|uniref:DNA polymerase III delta prime subunit n=1 Tax=Sphaerotilus uruguayifluvii TaxID=2735897 RepID=A0ABX2G0Q7_9BURK|nr:AAA domain-containing protein [Leptothrix sp. C29]NRT55634.1 DNA polymerase III delta prime subunit [Leptothrix sp. C29]
MQLHESPLLSRGIHGAHVIGRDFDAKTWQTSSEVVVRSAEGGGRLLLRQDDRIAEIEPAPDAGSLLLHAQNLDVLWVLAQARGQGAKSARVGLHCLVPMQAVSSESAFEIGVDQRVADSLHQQMRIDQPVVASAVEWLTDEFVCPVAGDEALGRVFVCPRERGDVRAMQLIGRRFRLDLKRDDQQVFWVERTAKRPASEDDACIVMTGAVRFVDASAGVQPQEPSQRLLLDTAVTSFGTYLELWSLYGQKEWVREVTRAAELQSLSYTACVPASDEGGGWRLTVQTDALNTFRDRWKKLASDDDQVELDDEAPDWNSDYYTDLEHRDRRRIFRGEPQWLRDGLVVKGESRKPPPPSGHMYLSLAGHRTQHERRLSARRAIDSGAGVKTLRALLQDVPTPTQRPSTLTALTPYARQSFRSGRPTTRQEEAVRVALNTPDIALIIGPPGTGKTQVIAALERRLSELNEGQLIAHDVLVSSFQHDAVENALERTEVYGLPAVKVGGSARRRDEFDPVSAWRERKEQAMSARVQQMEQSDPSAPLLVELDRQVHRLLLLGVEPGERQRALDDLDDCLRALGRLRIRPGAAWQSDWGNYREQPPAPAQVAQSLSPARRRMLLRRVRALRCQAVAFEDDGPAQAHKVRGLLRHEAGLMTAADEALLLQASDADRLPDAALLEALSSLRDALIDRLRPDWCPVVQRHRLDDQARGLLQRLQTELADKVRESRHGVHGVLIRYRDALGAYPDQVHRAVKAYSSIVGATCQQAASRHMSLLKTDKPDAPSMRSLQFGSVIIDEAARANPLDLLVPMALASRRIVLVGDHRQLPHLLDSEIEDEIRAERGDQASSKVYRDSLFERLWRQLQQRAAADGFSRVVMLDTQFRMHPRLGDFVSRQFYERAGLGQVHSGRPASDFEWLVPGHGSSVCAWIDVPQVKGLEDRSGASRRRQVEAWRVAHEVSRLLKELPEDKSIGVITFYAAQRDEILAALGGSLPKRLHVGTVDAFQGKEFDVVVLSVVRCNTLPLSASSLSEGCTPDETEQRRSAQERVWSRKYGHLRTANRLNVAMSRQRRLLIAVGDRAMFEGEASREAVPEMCAFLDFCDAEARLHARETP